MNFLAASLYAVASSVLLGILLGFLHGALNPDAAMVALLTGLAVGVIGWWQGRGQPALPRPTGWAWVAIGFFALFSLRAFLWLIFPDHDELCVLSPNNLGDMALHLTFINYLSNGAPFWPDSPIFAAGKLTYAAGMDIFNSLLALVGVDVVRGLIWTGLLGAFATGLALLRWGGGFTLAAFLFSGGLAGIALFTSDAGLPIFRDYQAEWAWKNLPLAILVTQRGFLFALPAGLLLLGSWRARLFGGTGWKLPFAGELLLYASMPVFHVHTFLVLSFMIASFFLVHRPARARIAGLVALAFVPATALLYLSAGMFKSNAEPMWQDMAQIENPPASPPIDALGWQPGWMVNDAITNDVWDNYVETHPAAAPFAAHGKFLIFWFGNFGVLPLLLVPLMLALLRPILPRPPSLALALAFFAAVIWITPLLGAWTGYQKEPLAELLTGNSAYPGLRSAAFALVALAAAAAGLVLHHRNPRDFGLRWVLLAFAGLYMLDGLLAGLHAWDSRVPLLRASAAPLVLAAYIFGALMWRIARHSGAGLWPAASAIPALFLFFVCCNVRFTNWDWDNTKLMLWSFLIIMPVLWDVVIAHWKMPVRTATCALLFFSGFLSLFGGIDETHRGYSITRLATLDAVSQAVRKIPVTEPFAAQPNYNHPLLLCGRKTVMGYEGHLASHGIRYADTADDLDALMLGFPDWRLRAARLGVRYLFYGPGERETWPNSYESWRLSATVIASGDWGQLLDLETPPIPLEAR
jgi:hypothetical protein